MSTLPPTPERPACASVVPPVHPGRRYDLIGRLGSGSHGQVFLAEQVGAGGFRRRVALKVLQDDHDPDGRTAARLRDEARVLGRLHHRAIVGVTDLIRVQGGWAVVLEYVPGRDLAAVAWSERQRQRDLPVKAVLQVGAEVLGALHEAWHADNGEGQPLRLVHRDIKPSNLMLTPAGEVRVLDFGVARADVEGRESETGHLCYVGTTLYMAPECLLGERATPSSDVYSTAATVLELIVGEPLGRSPVVPERHHARLADALQGVRDRLGPGPFADAVCAALRQGLAVVADERPDPRVLAASLAALASADPGRSLVDLAHDVVDRDTRVQRRLTGSVYEVPSTPDAPCTPAAGRPARVAGPGDRDGVGTSLRPLTFSEPLVALPAHPDRPHDPTWRSRLLQAVWDILARLRGLGASGGTLAPTEPA